MTPKEKALEIFNKMCNSVDELLPLDVKDCAKVAIDEMIKEYQSMSDLKSILVINDEVRFVVNQLIYWQEVKQEIELL